MSVQKSILTYIKREAVKRNPLVEVRNSPSKRFKSSLSDSGCDSGRKVADTKNKDTSLDQVSELKCDDCSKSFEESNNSGSDILTGDNSYDDVPEPRRWESNKVEAKRRAAKLKLLSNRCTILDPNMDLDWFAAMEAPFSQPSFIKLNDFINTQRKTTTVYPPQDLVWTWTKFCKVNEIKAIIIGQDPYHRYGQAHGLSFSVPPGVTKPPSLVNIFKELTRNYEKLYLPDHGYLMGWAMQGVLMLNVVLTVEEEKPNSHKNQGWEDVTIGFIKYINDHLDGLVFMLWGKNAQVLEAHIDKKKHHILTAGHPAQTTEIRFFGCRHFKKCNMILKEQHKVMINWQWLPQGEYEPGKEIPSEIFGRKKLRFDKIQSDIMMPFLDARLFPNISQYINFNDFTRTKKKISRKKTKKVTKKKKTHH